MNTLIIYSSKYGCTADCAKRLKSGLSGSVSLSDIDKTFISTSNIKNFDTIILGSSVYIGHVSKKMRTFCKENEEILSRKRAGIFLCCAFPEQLKEYLTSNFPPSLLKKAVVVKSFGGEARINRLKAIDKLIMKAALKASNKDLNISNENIDSFSRTLQAL